MWCTRINKRTHYVSAVLLFDDLSNQSVPELLLLWWLFELSKNTDQNWDESDEGKEGADDTHESELTATATVVESLIPVHPTATSELELSCQAAEDDRLRLG